MRKYELTFLASPDLSEEEVSAVLKEVSSFVEKSGGETINSPNFSRRTLGHEIDDNDQAYLVEATLSLDPQKINDLKEMLLGEKKIVRHIIVTKKEISDKQREKSARRRTKPEEEVAIKSTPKKVSIGDIDKKIDEILSD